MPPRRRCPTCGSRQWHKEPSSGLIACSEGHVLQNYRNEVIEAEEMGPHALRKRTLRSGRKKKEGTSRADPRLYHGARARFHYFECLQLILRKQIVALSQLWELPPEFEMVCRDLWALYLDLLPDPLPAEPHHFATEKNKEAGEDTNGSPEKNDPGRASTPKSRISSSPKPPAQDEEGEEIVNTDDESGDDDEDDEEGTEGEDEELAALLQENSEVSSSSVSSSESGSESETDQKPKKGRYAYETPANTLSVLITAFWTLRIPVLARDLIRLIESYDLPYLDPIARRIIPESMVIHLTKHNIQALSPYRSPDTMTLHALASRLCKLLYSNYGIFTPEANAAPILWRVTEQALGGTPVLYSLIKDISRDLSIPLTLHHTLAPGLAQLRAGDPSGHNYDNIPPEVGFAAAGVVVLKMVYGLDGRKRVPRSADDPASALPNIEDYLRGLKELDVTDGLTKDAVFSSRSPMYVADLDEEMTDAYLDFCEKALVGGDGDDVVLANYFPLEKARGKDEDGGDLEGDERRQVSATEIGDTGLRPGEGHRIYNSRDVMGTMGVEYSRVLRRAAGWTGVEQEYLGGVVEKYERRLMRWWEKQQRLARERR
ncbi:hypothetical protein BDZ94DRAFT_1161887 [Collybia nuda]|uniref:RRN7-type domain-containing protein n=1 Tax=Collybia nuda TaxID=64659 RepID=A0A9P6CFS6_9AGAR|nr:hypothetical protein BDZ94DRAFT_1161887 [Collybia nuda]